MGNQFYIPYHIPLFLKIKLLKGNFSEKNEILECTIELKKLHISYKIVSNIH